MELNDWMSVLGSPCTLPVMDVVWTNNMSFATPLRGVVVDVIPAKQTLLWKGSGLHDERASVDRHVGLHFQWQNWSNMYVSVYQTWKGILQKLGLRQERAGEDQC